MLSNVRLHNLLQRKQKKTNPTPKPITVLQIVQTIVLENKPRNRVLS